MKKRLNLLAIVALAAFASVAGYGLKAWAETSYRSWEAPWTKNHRLSEVFGRPTGGACLTINVSNVNATATLTAGVTYRIVALTDNVYLRLGSTAATSDGAAEKFLAGQKAFWQVWSGATTLNAILATGTASPGVQACPYTANE